MKAILVTCFIAFSMLSNSPVFATPLTEELAKCSRIEADIKRLSCYDMLTDSLKDRAKNEFGKKQKSVVTETPSFIEARIVSITKGAYHKSLIKLDNGQVWRQNDDSRIHWKTGSLVVVEKAMLGSFFMQAKDGGRKVRVKRAQ
ncbi:hypothetical protein ACJJIR_06705 [Microbulbifer sp. SSSA008]|uniref:hypothetical protein n=1 Tax=unclassified Microbulbifer TaxID=2619833 RepID=UPI0040394EE2